jgi:hypothetical protein
MKSTGERMDTPVRAITLSSLLLASTAMADTNHLRHYIYPFNGVDIISETELATMRGGLLVGGVDISFGARLRTMIDSVVVESVYTIRKSGPELVSQRIDERIQRQLAPAQQRIAAVDRQIANQLNNSATQALPKTDATPVAPPVQPTSSGSIPTLPNNNPVEIVTATGSNNEGTATTGSGSVPSPTTPVPEMALPQGGDTAASFDTTSSNPVPVSTGNHVVIINEASSIGTTGTIITEQQVNTSNSIPENNTTSTNSSVGLSTPGLNNFIGFAVNDSKGFTAALHKLSQQAILTAIVSNASNRDIEHQLNIDISVNNVKNLKSAATRSRLLQATRPLR